MIIDVLWPTIEANKQFSSIIMLIGAIRLVIKPLWSMYEAYVKWSESKEDDANLIKFKDSQLYKVGCWAIDYIFSVKVGSQVVAEPVVEPENKPVEEKKSPQ